VVGITSAAKTLLLVVVQDVVLAAIVIAIFLTGVFVLRSAGRRVTYSLSSLGLRRPRNGILRGVGLGIATGLAGILVETVANPISVLVLRHFGYSAKSSIQQPFMQGLEGWVRQSPGVAIPAMIAVVVLFGPAVEELVFRGAIFNGLYRLGALLSSRLRLKRGRGVSFWVAAIVSSSLFALLHLEPVIFLSIFVLALLLCYVFFRTGSILTSFAAHATFNSLAVIVIILDGLRVLNLPV